VSSLFHRRPSAQEPVPASARRLEVGVPSSTVPTLRQQGADIAHRLAPPYVRLLVEVAVITLDGSREPYVPASAEAAHLAAWLAQPSAGLLLPGSAGYVSCYSLSPLGAAAVRALLDDLLVYYAQSAQVIQQVAPTGQSSNAAKGGTPYGRW
jgi:hypothetical protein